MVGVARACSYLAAASLAVQGGLAMRPGSAVGAEVVLTRHTNESRGAGAVADDIANAAKDASEVVAATWNEAVKRTQHGLASDFDEALLSGYCMGLWANWSIIMAVLLCCAWSVYPWVLAEMRMEDDDHHGHLNIHLLNVLGTYDWIPADASTDEWSAFAKGPETYEEHKLRMFQNIPQDLRVKRREIMVAEAWFSEFQPFIAIAIWGTIAYFVGPKIVGFGLIWQIGMMAPPIIRGCIAEARLSQRHVMDMIRDDGKICKFPPFPYIRTKGEIIDQVTDGMSVVTIFMLENYDPVYQQRIGAVWGSDPWGWLFSPMQSLFGLSGVLFILLVVCGAIQMIGVLIRIEDDGWLAADTAGFGGLAEKILAHRASETAEDLEYKHFGRSLYEGVPQLLISGTAIIAEGDGMLGSPVLLASMSLGIIMLTWRSSVLMRLGYDGRGIVSVIAGIIMFFVVFWIVLRLWMSESCPSKIFNLLTWQCVVHSPTSAAGVPP